MTENIKNETQVEHYDNGQKKLELRYINGVKDGVQTSPMSEIGISFTILRILL